MICPLCKKLRLIAKHFWHSRYKPIRCCMDCYNKMKANKVARIKAEQRRILREESQGVDRLLEKVLKDRDLILDRFGIIKIRRQKWKKKEEK